MTATGSAGLRTALVGETGFERAAVWSAVGFGLAYAAFDAAALFGGPSPEWIALAAGVLAALGAVALAGVGGGVLPCVLLAYGPFAAVLLRIAEPRVLPAPAEQLLGAVAVAVAVGTAGYLLARALTAVAGSSAGVDEPNADR